MNKNKVALIAGIFGLSGFLVVGLVCSRSKDASSKNNASEVKKNTATAPELPHSSNYEHVATQQPRLRIQTRKRSAIGIPRPRLTPPRRSGGPLPRLSEMKRISPMELIRLEPGLANELQTNLMSATREGTVECVDAFRKRGLAGDLTRQRLEHTMILAVSAREGEATIRDAQGDEGWPATFDQDLQECLREAFKGAEFEADRDYDYKIEWPIVLR